MDDNQLIYYCQNNYLFAIKAIYEKYVRLVHKICWNYYRKYPLLYSDFNITLSDGKFVFFQAVNKFEGHRKISFRYFLCLHLKYYFIQKIRTNLNNKNKALVTALSYQKIVDYHNILKCPKENVFKKASDKISYDQIMNSLKKEDQEIISLWTQGYSYKEISRRNQLPVKKVDNKIQRIIRHHKKMEWNLNKLN